LWTCRWRAKVWAVNMVQDCYCKFPRYNDGTSMNGTMLRKILLVGTNLATTPSTNSILIARSMSQPALNSEHIWFSLLTASSSYAGYRYRVSFTYKKRSREYTPWSIVTNAVVETHYPEELYRPHETALSPGLFSFVARDLHSAKINKKIGLLTVYFITTC